MELARGWVGDRDGDVASNQLQGPSKGAYTTIKTQPFIARPWRPPAPPLRAP